MLMKYAIENVETLLDSWQGKSPLSSSQCSRHTGMLEARSHISAACTWAQDAFHAPIALRKDRLRTGDFAELGGSLIVQRGHGVIGHADDPARFRPMNCAQQRIAGCIESSRQSVGGCRVEQHRV